MTGNCCAFKLTSGTKSNFTCLKVTLFETGIHFFSFGCSEVKSTWLITSELANQRARKALFTSVVYTKYLYLLVIEFYWYTIEMLLSDRLGHCTLSAISVQWLGALLTFESTFANKWIIKFPRRLLGGHLRFLELNKARNF